jgi:polyferredoxin
MRHLSKCQTELNLGENSETIGCMVCIETCEQTNADCAVNEAYIDRYASNAKVIMWLVLGDCLEDERLG